MGSWHGTFRDASSTNSHDYGQRLECSRGLALVSGILMVLIRNRLGSMKAHRKLHWRCATSIEGACGLWIHWGWIALIKASTTLTPPNSTRTPPLSPTCNPRFSAGHSIFSEHPPSFETSVPGAVMSDIKIPELKLLKCFYDNFRVHNEASTHAKSATAYVSTKSDQKVYIGTSVDPL